MVNVLIVVFTVPLVLFYLLKVGVPVYAVAKVVIIHLIDIRKLNQDKKIKKEGINDGINLTTSHTSPGNRD